MSRPRLRFLKVSTLEDMRLLPDVSRFLLKHQEKKTGEDGKKGKKIERRLKDYIEDECGLNKRGRREERSIDVTNRRRK